MPGWREEETHTLSKQRDCIPKGPAGQTLTLIKHQHPALTASDTLWGKDTRLMRDNVVTPDLMEANREVLHGIYTAGRGWNFTGWHISQINMMIHCNTLFPNIILIHWSTKCFKTVQFDYMWLHKVFKDSWEGINKINHLLSVESVKTHGMSRLNTKYNMWFKR